MVPGNFSVPLLDFAWWNANRPEDRERALEVRARLPDVHDRDRLTPIDQGFERLGSDPRNALRLNCHGRSILFRRIAALGLDTVVRCKVGAGRAARLLRQPVMISRKGDRSE